MGNPVRTLFFTGLTAWAITACVGSPVYAQSCDCTQKLDECTPDAKYNGRQIFFSASTRQCAQITYDVDGEPSSITITDGKGAVDYTPADPGHKPKISVNSCSVCKTNQ